MDLTVKDAARMLGVSEDTIYGWVENDTLPSYRIGDKCRLNRVELLEWAAARKMTVAPSFFHTNGSKPSTLLLSSAIRSGGILFDLPCSDKPSALKAVCDAMPLPPKVNREELHSVLIAREALCSTGIGNGIAIPHPRGPIVLGVSEPQVTLAFPRQPIEYGALDHKPVTVLCVIVSTTVRVHLLLLSHLMFAMEDAPFRQLLDERASQERILERLEEVEAQVAQREDAERSLKS